MKKVGSGAFFLTSDAKYDRVINKIKRTGIKPVLF